MINIVNNYLECFLEDESGVLYYHGGGFEVADEVAATVPE